MSRLFVKICSDFPLFFELNITMSMFDELSDDNYYLYAARAYNNPQCENKEEFEDDLKRVHYIKKLLNKYISTGELKSRLILNHMTLLHNVFGVQHTARMLFFKLDDELYPALAAFLIARYSLPKKVNGINTATIMPDDKIINILRNLLRGDHE